MTRHILVTLQVEREPAAPHHHRHHWTWLSTQSAAVDEVGANEKEVFKKIGFQIPIIRMTHAYQKYSSDAGLFRSSASEREMCVNVLMVLARKLRTGKYAVIAIHIPSILIGHTFNI